jgi:N-acetylmuramoyl-L-alanine amidase
VTNPALPIRERISPNQGARRAGAPIDMLVLHYTGMASAAIALDRLCDPAFQVSAHYVIEEDGALWRLVAEDRRAWHAGASSWAGDTDINSRSIGIELVNPGHGPDYRPFPEAQMAVLETLCRDILARYPISAHRIVAHSDIAPVRKIDPGELFDALMRRFGYADSSTESVIAFQRRFRPAAMTGIADPETQARLAALVKQAGLA